MTNFCYTLQYWDDGLAQMAQATADECNYEHGFPEKPWPVE